MSSQKRNDNSPLGATVPPWLSLPVVVPAVVEPLSWHQMPRVRGPQPGRTGSLGPLGQDLAQTALPFMKFFAFD